MNFATIAFTLLTGVFLLKLPRCWAPLPLLLGASYMTLGQSVQLGPFHFTVIRVLVATGFLRVLARGERLGGGWHSLDRVMLLWGGWALCSSCFHKDISSTLIGQLGLVYDCLGLYFLLRVFIQDTNDILLLCRIIIILLVPIALEMVTESITGRNRFSIFGGVAAECEVRGGKIRAQGPFAHSILAGTVGAVCLPLALVFWNRNRKLGILGIAATTALVITSKSSGPIMTAMFALSGLALWKVRSHLRAIRWGAVLAVILLNTVMEVPVYYLLARIDLTGKSTGWHRAALIDSTIKHFDEWWIGGTDYTRHWMPTGAFWSDQHTDITNHYIRMGVSGGLPMMALFVCILTFAFVTVGKAVRLREGERVQEGFLIWTLGSTLFGHAATMMSVSYFDQSIIFLYLVLASIGSIGARDLSAVPADPQELQPEAVAPAEASRAHA